MVLKKILYHLKMCSEGNKTNFRFCRKRIRRTLLHLFPMDSFKKEERERGCKHKIQSLSGAYACHDIGISPNAKEQSR